MDPVLIGELLSGLMFFGIIGFLLLGFPVAFTLAGVSLMFGLGGMWFGVFDPSNFGSLANRYIGYMTNEVLVAVPLFIFMGVMLERSKIAEQLLLTMGKLFGNLRGGLGMSVIIVGALLAASTGVVGATVVTMGLISLPAMLRANYDPKLATGVICASGTLGQIIRPPRFSSSWVTCFRASTRRCKWRRAISPRFPYRWATSSPAHFFPVCCWSGSISDGHFSRPSSTLPPARPRRFRPKRRRS